MAHVEHWQQLLWQQEGKGQAEVTCQKMPSVLLRRSAQCSVAEWLGRWANLGVIWEVVGSNPTAGMSRLGFFIQGRNSNGFS